MQFHGFPGCPREQRPKIRRQGKSLSKPLSTILALATVLFAACSSSRPAPRVEQKTPTYHREAMRHVIDAAIAELVGLPQNAIIEYHQAAEIDSSSPGIYVSLAENYYFLGENQTSIRLAQKALRLAPDNLEALELLAAAYEKDNRLSDAIKAYESILRLNPHDIEILYNLTALQLLTGNHEQAYASYQSLLQAGMGEPEFRLQIGQLFLKKPTLAYAETIFQDFLAAYPTRQEPYLGMAAIAILRQDTTAALGLYRQALQQNPHFEDAEAELRMLLEKQQNWPLASEIYRDLVQQDPSNLDNRLKLAQFYFFSKDTAKAGEEFGRAAQDHPDEERAILAHAEFAKMVQDTLAAVSIYHQALAQNPEFFTVRRLLRDLFGAAHRYDDAIALYQPLTGIDSTTVGASIEIANLTLLKGDTLQALQMVQKLTEKQGNDWRVPTTLARYNFILKNHQQAALHLDKSLMIRQDLPGVWVLRGINYMRMDSLQLALDNFIQALAKYPDDPEMNYYTGFLYNQQRKFSKALPFLRAAVKADSQNVQTMLTLASTYDELRQFDQSEALYERIMAIDSSTPLILNNFAYHLSVRDSDRARLDKALELVTRALAADPDNAAYLDTMGWIYYKMQEFDLAKTYIEKSLTISPSAEVFEHLGDIYLQKNEPAKARAAWKEALKLDQNNQRILMKIQELQK